MASRIATTYGNQLIAMLNALPIAAMSLLFLAPMLQFWLWVWGPLRPFGVAEVPAPSLATLYTVQFERYQPCRAGDDGRDSFVGAPLRPVPKPRVSGVALPEPDEDRPDD